MRYILNFLRVLICIYLTCIFVIFISFFVLKEVLNYEYPNIYGYSYYKIKDNNLSPQIEKNEYLLLKSNNEYKKDDYILCKINNNKEIRKIKKVNDDDYEIIDTKNNLNNIKKDDIYAKVIYRNKTISKVLHIFTNIFVIILLIIYVVKIPSLTYKRY